MLKSHYYVAASRAGEMSSVRHFSQGFCIEPGKRMLMPSALCALDPDRLCDVIYLYLDVTTYIYALRLQIIIGWYTILNFLDCFFFVVINNFDK